VGVVSTLSSVASAYEENGGRHETNPFDSCFVRIYLRDVRDFQAKARCVGYEKKRKRPKPNLCISVLATTTFFF